MKKLLAMSAFLVGRLFSATEVPPGSTIHIHNHLNQTQQAQQLNGQCLPCMLFGGEFLYECFFSLSKRHRKDLFAAMDYAKRCELLGVTSISEVRDILNYYTLEEWQDLTAGYPQELQEFWSQENLTKMLDYAESSSNHYTALKKTGMVIGGMFIAAAVPGAGPFLMGAYLFGPDVGQHTQRSHLKEIFKTEE